MEKIKEKVVELLSKENVYLYSFSYLKKYGTNILEIVIEKEDFSMDLVTLSDISSKISDLLDELDLISDEYTLDVVSTGAERALKELSEYAKVIGKYVHLEFKEKVEGLDKINGYLKEVVGENLLIEYKAKKEARVITVAIKNVKKGNLAIKF
jgi:ribosome maturation factor RimP